MTYRLSYVSSARVRLFLTQRAPLSFLKFITKSLRKSKYRNKTRSLSRHLVKDKSSMALQDNLSKFLLRMTEPGLPWIRYRNQSANHSDRRVSCAVNIQRKKSNTTASIAMCHLSALSVWFMASIAVVMYSLSRRHIQSLSRQLMNCKFRSRAKLTSLSYKIRKFNLESEKSTSSRTQRSSTWPTHSKSSGKESTRRRENWCRSAMIWPTSTWLS